MWTEQFPKPKDKMVFNLHLPFEENFSPVMREGLVIIEMHDVQSGELLFRLEKKNVVTRDAGIQAARLFKDNQEPNFGAYMLAVGTGATGAVLSPDAPDERQRKLNAEITRKAFASTTFRTAAGVAVAYPTHILDLTTTFGAAEAVGPLNEMGLLSPISANPLVLNPNPNNFPTYDDTLDITNYDVLLNYLSFGIITVPNTATITFTWRLTF